MGCAHPTACWLLWAGGGFEGPPLRRGVFGLEGGDEGADVGFPGVDFGGGAVVGGDFGEGGVEGGEEGTGAVEPVAMDVGFAVGDEVAVGAQGVFGGAGGVAACVPEFGEVEGGLADRRAEAFGGGAGVEIVAGAQTGEDVLAVLY